MGRGRERGRGEVHNSVKHSFPWGEASRKREGRNERIRKEGSRE